jgi:sigma-B regulation protein RsbU (phosphoserine phosphatase)
VDVRHPTKDLLANLLNHSSDNIYFKDMESRIILVNDAFAKWVGYDDPEGLVGKTDFDLFKEEHARPAFDDEQRILKTREPILGIEEKEVRQDGRVTWVSTSKMPLFDDNGELMGTFGVSRDITAHKEAQQKLVEYAEELELLNRQIQEDIAMADRFQKAFLPHAYPRFAQAGQSQAVEFGHLYKAGGRIGGDFCAIRKLSDRKTAILVCDVMGHGVRSALVTGIVRALSEELLRMEQDPGALLSEMNARVYPILRQSDDFVFLTACCLVLDVHDGSLHFANAGHPVPLHLKSDGGAGFLPSIEDPPQPAMPLFPDTTYVTGELSLDPGDVVVIYTDGLVETQNAEREEYGSERLLKVFADHARGSLNTVFDALLADAGAFSGEDDFEDDVCLAGLRFFRPLAEGEIADSPAT